MSPLESYVATHREDLARIRNYFGENDRTTFDHVAFWVLNELLNKADLCVSDSSGRRKRVCVFADGTHGSRDGRLCDRGAQRKRVTPEDKVSWRRPN